MALHERAKRARDRRRTRDLRDLRERLSRAVRFAAHVASKMADVRKAFDAGYRMGYGNGHYDAVAAEDFDDSPGEAFGMWLEDADV